MYSKDWKIRYFKTIGFIAIIIVAIAATLVATLLVKYVCKDNHSNDYAVIIPSISVWVATVVYFLHKIDSYKHEVEIEHDVIDGVEARQEFYENMRRMKIDKMVVVQNNEVIEVDDFVGFFDVNPYVNSVRFLNNSKDTAVTIKFITDDTNAKEVDCPAPQKTNSITLLPGKWVWFVVDKKQELEIVYWHISKYSGGKKYVIK